MNARIEPQPKVTAPPPDRFVSSLRREHGFEPLRVEGAVPPELRGTLYRVGPGLMEAQGVPYGHLFEADGAVCAVRLMDGRAEGAHRVVRSAQLLEERDAGKPLYGSAASWLRRVINNLRLKGKNAANTNLLEWQDRLFALYEVSRATELSRDLGTIGETSFDGVVKTAFSAHHHRVASTGTIYNFGVRFTPRQSFIDLYELPVAGPARCITSIPLEVFVMLHDFIATENHLVFFVSPSVLKVGRALMGFPKLEELIRWEPERGTEVIVVPLAEPTRVTRFTVDAFYQWHFANAFEQDGELFADLVRYPNLDTFDEIGTKVTDFPGGELTRVRVDTRNRRLEHTTLDDTPSEFPHIDARFAGTAHDRVWLDHFGSLSQHDLKSGERRIHTLSPNQHASEPVFVPRSDNAPEGDGWVLTLIYDGPTATSHVAIIDTQRFDDAPVARVWFDHHIPVTFHGLWSQRT